MIYLKLKDFLASEGGKLIIEIGALAVMLVVLYLLGVADWMRKKGEFK